jgi:hypothetical protein
MKHKKSTPDDNVDAWDLVSQIERRTSTFIIPRYLANLNFWDIYSVGNSKTRKPGETTNKPHSSQKVGIDTHRSRMPEIRDCISAKDYVSLCDVSNIDTNLSDNRKAHDTGSILVIAKLMQS